MPRFLAAPVSNHAEWPHAVFVTPVRLSAIQIRILNFIRDQQNSRGSTPTYREIGERMHLAATSVSYQIQRLAQLGVLVKPSRMPRAIRLTGVPVEPL